MKLSTKWYKWVPILIALALIIDGALTVLLSILDIIGPRIGYDFSYLKRDLVIGYHLHVLWVQILICYLFLILAKGIYERKRISWAIALLLEAFLVGIGSYLYGINTMLVYHIVLFIILIASYKMFSVKFAGFHLSYYQWIVLITFVLTIIYGVCGSYLLREQFIGLKDWSDALYFTVGIYSTVGSNVIPESPDAKWFTISMIVFGLGTFATALTAIILPIMEERIKNVITLMQHVKHLQNHTIVCGYNSISKTFIKQLIKAKKPYIVVADNELSPSDGINAINGKIYHEEILTSISIKTAKRIISLYDNDSENILTGITAKAIADRNKHALEIVLRIDNEENIEKATDLGANKVVSPSISIAAEIG